MRRKRALPSSGRRSHRTIRDVGSDAEAGGPKTGSSAVVGDDEPRAKAVSAGLALLARRPYSVAGLEQKLRDKFGPDPAAAAVARMVELRVLDDQQFAEALVRDRFERRGYGRHRVQRDLIAAGIEPDLAEQVVQAGVDVAAERVQAERALAKFLRRRGAHRTSTIGAVQADRASAFRHLVGRGFPAALVRDLIGVSL